MNVYEKLLASRAMAGRVKRYHAWPTLHQETVGEHSWRVASLYVQIFGTPRAEVLEYALHHDLGELMAGDSPFYAKREFPGLKFAMDGAEKRGLERLQIVLPDLTEEERRRFKLCDLLQMMEFALIEVEMGNRYAQLIVTNIMEALKILERDIPHDVVRATEALVNSVPREEEDTDDDEHEAS